MPDPLILAAAFDTVSFARLDADRREHFPRALNRIPAHLTLFHHLPGDDIADIAEALATACRRPPLSFTVTGPRFLGRGVALDLAAPGLVALRQGLAHLWADHLTLQDRQGFRPHVTIQNKVAPDQARALFERRRDTHQPWSGTLTGLDLWFYRGGPWERAGAWAFAGAEEAPPTDQA